MRDSDSSQQPVIELTGISKTFPAQRALSDVSLTVLPGEVHALLGENGSGKSTLIKILSGYYAPDPGGTLLVAGEPLSLASPHASHEVGLRFVHQNLAVIPQFNAVENMALDTGYTRPRFIDWDAQAREAERLLARLNVEMDIWRPLAECRPVERSAVAIARAINVDRGLVRAVVLDEPTSSLPDPEVEQLFRVIRDLTATGVAVIYVTHRLDEVFEIADRVSVLRDGRHQGTVERSSLTRQALVELIVGKALVHEHEAADPRPVVENDEDLLRIDGLSAGRLEDVSFRVRKGEVVGVVGLAGSGREDVARALVGAIPADTGTIAVRGRVLSHLNPKRALEHGIVLGLSNTQPGSAVRDFSIGENVTMASLSRYRTRFGPLRFGRERRDASTWIGSMDVRPTNPDRQYGLLSGGNQQKVIFSKCLNAQPTVLVLDDPTAGVDVGARQALYGVVAAEAEKGLGVIVCSNDLEDVVRTCHRVLVIRHGRVIAEIEGHLDERQLMSIAAHEDDGEPAVGVA